MGVFLDIEEALSAKQPQSSGPLHILTFWGGPSILYLGWCSLSKTWFSFRELLNFFMYQEIKATKMSNDNNKINTN